MTTPTAHPICPRCGGFIPNDEHPGQYPGALSRHDNKTEVCSDCGRREALQDILASLPPSEQWVARHD